MIDATEGGLRLGQVFGLIGGAGNGKTTTALNLFRWFAEFNVNKDFIHLFVSLEMPKADIKKRWKKMAAKLKLDRPDIDWDNLVYVLDNFNADGTFRKLGLADITAYVKKLEKKTGKKVACLVVDHIGILRQRRGAADGPGGLIEVCEGLKPCAIETQTLFVIQSQTSRGKNQGGDVELNMDAAFGTSQFENYADFVMTTWQPLKRIYNQMDATNMICPLAFKLAKIRDKDVIKDKIKADTIYGMAFDPTTELLRTLTSDEHKSIDTFWMKKAAEERDRNKRTEPGRMFVIDWIPPPSGRQRVP